MALTRVCHDVATEPRPIEPLQGEQFRSASTATTDGARLDISASGFWGGRFERTFFDVQVFNPNVQSNVLSVSQASTVATSAKTRQIRAAIQDVERSTFCPLIWSTSGGAGPAATCFLKRLADKLSERTEEPYSTTMGWLRCRLGFALTRSAVMCLRGSRSRAGHPRCAVEPALASAEGRLPNEHAH